MFFTYTHVLISNITKNKTTFIHNYTEPENLRDMVEFEVMYLKLFERIINETIQHTIQNAFLSFDIQMTNRQLNKLMWRIKHKINDDAMEPPEKNSWRKLRHILKQIR